MSKYVKNADLTLEYIVNRAYRLGAQSIYSDTRPGCLHSLVFEWGENHICSYAMQPCVINGWNMNHANNLPSLRKSIENHGYYLRLQREQSDEDRMERQTQAYLESAALHRDDPIF